MNVILTWDRHPTPLPLTYSLRAWSTSRDVKEGWGWPPVDMLLVLEFRMVTQAARERVSLTAFTLTTPLFWYSFQFASSELNRSLYDVTQWILMAEGLPCVAILLTTLSFPRSICKYCPIVFWRVHQAPAYPLFLILLRRACHGSDADPHNEDAFTASFGICLFSIPRGWMRHSVGRNTNYFLFTFTCRSNSRRS